MFINGKKIPLNVNSGKWCEGHVQGIAVDTESKYIYYSFTTILVKTDMDGNVIGTVEGLLGHLGCIDFNDEDGKVYGSLELKHDSIGKGIMDRTGKDIAEEDAFYIAIFDVDKIDRVGMDAESDGVMRAVYLSEVLNDYKGTDTTGHEHIYGCSGIDGTSIGPVFGCPPDTPTMLMVAYGIYSDVTRYDNNHQVILQYDWRRFAEYAQPLVQGQPHHSGPSHDAKYFLYTGNTNWGVQNLEYDAFTGDWLLAVYEGKKESYPNFPMFVIDGRVAPVMSCLKGRGQEQGLVLTLSREGYYDESTDISGLGFEYGSTGLYSFGNGYFYVSHNGKEKVNGKNYFYTDVKLYKRVPGDVDGFKLVKKKDTDTDGTRASIIAKKEAKKSEKKKNKKSKAGAVAAGVAVAGTAAAVAAYNANKDGDLTSDNEYEEMKKLYDNMNAEEKKETITVTSVTTEEVVKEEKTAEKVEEVKEEPKEEPEKEEIKKEEPKEENNNSEWERVPEFERQQLTNPDFYADYDENVPQYVSPADMYAEEDYGRKNKKRKKNRDPYADSSNANVYFGNSVPYSETNKENYMIKVIDPKIAENVFRSNGIQYNTVRDGFIVDVDKNTIHIVLNMLCFADAGLLAVIPLN